MLCQAGIPFYCTFVLFIVHEGERHTISFTVVGQVELNQGDGGAANRFDLSGPFFLPGGVVVRAIWISVLCLGVVLPSCAIGQDKDEAKERTLWVYESGWFQKKEGKNWIEVNQENYDGPGKLNFREMKRTKEFVELNDDSRKISVRLYDKKVEFKQGDDEEWNHLYDGRWKE
jgi:hypothetical protein